MLFLTAIVTFCAIWFTGEIAEHQNAFYACLLLIAGGAIGAFASIDLFFFYAFHELALIPTFLLIGIWGSGNRIAAAWKITIYLAPGSFILLLGLILLYRSVPEASRSFDFRALQKALPPDKSPLMRSTISISLLLIGFGILVSLFPFHTWAPEAYASAPAPAAMLHAGVLKKFGLYGLLRLAIPLLPEGARYWNSLLIVLLLGNIIYVGLVTIAQKRLDWMLGYSSVMHMGYIFLGIACANIAWHQRSGDADVRARNFHRTSLRYCRRNAATHGDTRPGQIWADSEESCRLRACLWHRHVRVDRACPVSRISRAKSWFSSARFETAPTMHHFHIFQIATVLALWGVVISAVYMLRAYRSGVLGDDRGTLQGPDGSPAEACVSRSRFSLSRCFGLDFSRNRSSEW